MNRIPEFVQWSADRFNSIDRLVRNTDRSDRRKRANHMVACCVSDCNVIDDETGEVVAECGDILVADDLERILALNATYLVTDGWQCTARRRTYERGSSDILAALCNLVLLIALVVFLLCVAPRLGLRLNLDWVAGLVGW